ncbi:hypothetical protein AWJ20_1354 [Sugiyamaella lignohabitans]|uniref:Vitamin H transporter 1 n=1 Tax=Sugiyamaella lignohabitans TaxID=796027 RepID=A0A167DMK5_9ASCO|nr:uncharacterized protein AWJ20_1354 [Sugiyamaella lignohabitans]ANB13075.1 hypothetical protein AWJ20_1354 [Sugiyamaella lignohabitans]
MDSPSKSISSEDVAVFDSKIQTYQTVTGQEESFEFSELEQKKLDKIYRKIDFRILPALFTLYFLTSFADSAYGVALTMNMEQGHSVIQALKLSPNDVSLATALNFVGFIVFDVPMNLIMTRVAPQAWMSRIVISVGLVYACFPAITSASGLTAARFFAGSCVAGCWPGMAYFISLWYPNRRKARRIGYYFTAAQLSAAVAGLVSAGFQKMDGMRGLFGYQWMFLVYGVVTICVGISLNWWLPGRPLAFGNEDGRFKNRILRFLTAAIKDGSNVLTPEERELHARDMAASYSKPPVWGLSELWKVFKDVRIWPLIMMYFGVVGAGYGLAVFASTIINNINPNLSSIDLSLLVAPIWLFDLAAILLITPFSDKYSRHRGIVFSFATLIIITGLLVTTYAPGPWSRYGGLLISGFGLGPTVPICMTWAAEIFGPRHGDLGTAASAALVSGLGNLGSVTTCYALYSGWPADAARGYRDSNMVMVAILGVSIIAAGACTAVRWALGDLKKTNTTASLHDRF